MLSLKISRYFSQAVHTPICIVGAGSGGISLLGHLIRQKGFLPHQVRIFDPSKLHHYQPGWTMIASGLSDAKNFVTETHKMINKFVPWESTAVSKILPKENKIITSDGKEFTYDHLVLSTGFRIDYNKIEGAIEALQDPDCPVASMYNVNFAVKMNKIADDFKGGLALFSDPNCAIKCAGSPHKIAFLSGDRWEKKGIRNVCNIEIHKGIGVYFSVPKYAENLAMLHKKVGNTVNLDSNLVKIDGKNRIAHFQNTKTQEITQKKFDLLHFVPPMSPHDFILESGLAGAGGYVDVDSETLRHKVYPNIWALGDNAGLPTSKTAAALMSQSIILMKNLMRTWMKNEPCREKYNGYTSCPIFVGGDKLMLCEFKYNAVLDETFFKNKQHIPSKMFFLIKRYMFPWVYFYLMPRGLWLGNKGIGMAFY